MEESRLKPMVDGYNETLFNELYQKTENLRYKLAMQIDHRRFGVDREEILSWFSVKFIFAYNKYCKKYNKDVLLGHLIRALQFFKYRIIKSAYTVKYSQNIVEFEGNEHNDYFYEEPENNYQNHYYMVLCDYMKSKLSDNAYFLLQLQINPPHYIIKRLNEEKIDTLHKIPNDLVLEYFDMGYCEESNRYIETLKAEIKNTIALAKKHFRESN